MGTQWYNSQKILKSNPHFIEMFICKQILINMLVGNVEAKQKENQITYSDQNCHDKSVIYKKVF